MPRTYAEIGILTGTARVLETPTPPLTTRHLLGGVRAMSQSTIERFLSKVCTSPDGCWLWQGRRNPSGYGRFDLRTGAGRWQAFLAHRVAYEIFVGKIPDGLVVCHACDNPCCVRPSHLSVGSQRDNLGDAAAKGRTARGETHPHAKLTAQQVAEMRYLFSQGVRQRELSRRFGTAYQNVSRIVRGERW